MKYLLLFTLISMLACKQDFPTTPTVINALVLDENDKPFYAVPYKYVGLQGGSTQDSRRETFAINRTSDENGIINVSQIVPKRTDYIYMELFPRSNEYYFSFKDDVEVSVNDTKFIPGPELRLGAEYFGKEIKLVFKVKRSKNTSNSVSTP